MKGIVDKLCKVHAQILESEKLELKKNMQTSEQKESGQSQESPSCNTLAPKIRRHYKLTFKSSFEVWIDCLNTKLTSWGSRNLIDPSQSALIGISEPENNIRKNLVKDIIINHIDEEYH